MGIQGISDRRHKDIWIVRVAQTWYGGKLMLLEDLGGSGFAVWIFLPLNVPNKIVSFSRQE